MGIYKPGRPSKYNPSTGGSKPPSSPGEYRIRDNSGQMCYIGETCDLNRRANEHRRTGKLAEGSTYEYLLTNIRLQMADLPLLHGENMSAVKSHSTILR